MSDSEQYGPAWIRATVMVHPCGDIHYIGGDRAPGEGDREYLAAKYLRHASKLEESAPSASTNIPMQAIAQIAALARSIDESMELGDNEGVRLSWDKLRQLLHG